MIDGALTLGTGSTVSVSLAGTQIDVNGVAALNGGNLLASGGGVINVNNVAGGTIDFGPAAMTFRATGTGSQINLPNVTTVTLAQQQTGTIEAISGGSVSFAGLSAINIAAGGFSFQTRDINFKADGVGSVIDLPALVTFDDQGPGRSLLQASAGGTINTPAMTAAKSVRMVVDATGSLDTAQITNLDGSRVEVTAQVVDFAGATSFVNGEMVVQGGGNALLPNLSNVTGASFTVDGGVTLSLPAVTSVSFDRPDANPSFIANGAGSVLDVSNATTLTLSRERSVAITATAGGLVDLGAVTTIDIAAGGFDFQLRDINITADGASSLVDLSSLTAFNDLGPGRSTLTPRNAGEIRTPALTTAHRLNYVIDGTGVVPTAQVTNAFGSRFQITNASVDLGNATTLQDGEIVLNAAGAIDIGSLTNADGASFFASAGATIDLPATVTSVNFNSANAATPVWRATGAGSAVNAPGVAQFSLSTIRSVAIEALTSGQINLPALTLIDIDPGGFDFQLRDINFKADGAGSLIDMSALVNFNDEGPGRSTLQAVNSGEIRVPNMTTATHVNFPIDGTGVLATAQLTGTFGSRFAVSNGASVDAHQSTTLQEGEIVLSGGGTINVDAVANINGANLLVNDGVTLALPSVTGVNHNNNLGEPVWRVTGAGSRIDASSITQFDLSTIRSVTMDALAGGVIDLSGMTLIDIDPGGFDFQLRNINFKADGAGSLIDLSALTNFNDEGPGRSLMQPVNGGEIRVPNLVTATHVNFVLNGTGTILTEQLTSTLGSRFEVSSTHADVHQSTTLKEGEIVLNAGGSIDLGAVTDIDGAMLFVNGGATLSLPSVVAVNFNNNLGEPVWRVTGAGSLLEVANIADFFLSSIRTVTIDALAGGRIDLSGLDVIDIDPGGFDFQTRNINFKADGANSVIDLTGMTLFNDEGPGRSILIASNGGVILLSDPLPVLNRVDIQFDGTFATGPSVVNHTVHVGESGQPPFVDFTFSEEVDRNTFGLGDVVVTGPGGASVAVLAVDRLDTSNLHYRVRLAAQTLPAGAYTMTIGPDIRDFAGNAMNQNANTTNGEAGDAFSVNFNVNLANLDVGPVTLNVTDVFFGETVEVTWTVTNTGSQPTSGSWLDRVYLSTNSTVGGDLLLDTIAAPPAPLVTLNPGDSYTVTRTVAIPFNAGLSDGAYFIIVRTDDAGGLSEQDELDNTDSATLNIATPVLPDLTITPTIAPTAAQSGSVVHLEWTTSNSGTAATTGSWVERIFLSTNTTVSGDDAKLFERTVSSPLAAGGSINATADVTIPIDRFGDGMHLIFVVDALDQIEEFTNEGNNTAVTNIDVTLGPIADLSATLLSAPTFVVGDPADIAVSWSVANVGTALGVDLAWNDAVILSADAIAGNFGDTIFRFANPQALSAGQSYTRTETITLPAGFTGQFHVFVVADKDGDVFENGAEANNTDEAGAILEVMPIPYADLVVSSITVPASAQSGKPMPVTFVVSNQGIGLTSTGQWNDKVFLATDAAGANRIAEFEFNHIGPISQTAPGNSYTRTVNVIPPNGFSGDLFVVVQAAAENGPFEFVFGGNNTSVSGAVPVTLSPSPDLTVTNILSPAAAEDGQAIDVTWTVTNQGAIAAEGSWEDLVFLQSETDPNLPVIPLGTFSFQGPLAVGASYTRTERIVIPNTTSGQFRVVVATNHDNRVFEDVTANNPVPDDTLLDVTLRPRPDLVVDDVIAPADVDAGSTLAVTFIVKNNGTAPTTPSKWKDIVYLSLDNQITNDDILIGEFDNGAALLPGQSYQTSTLSIAVPQRFRGSMFILVKPDHKGQVDEFPNENNLHAEPIFINPLPLADLVVSGVIVPAQATSGSTFDVTFSLDNLGSGATNISSYAGQIWLTIDKNRPNPQAGDILLKTFTVNAQLDVNAGVDITQTITLPANLQSGVYHITPWVDPFGAVLEDTLAINVNPDDPDEIDSNNFKAKAIDIVGTEPDLEVTVVNAPAVAQGGDLVNIQWTVENKSTGTARGRWVDRVYLSNMANPLDPAARAIMLHERFHDDTLATNESYTESVNVLLSPSAVGQFFVVVTDDEQLTIKDDFNALDEVFEDNNFTASATNVTNLLADLVVTDVVFEPNLRSGEPTTIRYTVTNQGPHAVWSGTEFWKDFIWIGRTEGFERLRSSFLGTHVQPAPASLAPGESYEVAFQTTLPQGLDGDYHLYIHLDAHNDLSPLFFPLDSRILLTGWFPADDGSNDAFLSEFQRWAFEDPNNNLHSEPVTIEFFEPNLVLDQIQLLSSALSGENLQIEYTVSNQGTRATRTGNYNDRFFLSRDQSLDNADLFIGSVTRNQVLGIGEDYTASTTLSLPEGVTGDFFIVGYTDSAASLDITGFFPSDIGFNEPGVMFEFLSPFVPFDMADLTRRELSRGKVFEFQNEGDNILPKPVTITLSPAPDLQITNLLAPASVLAGQTFSVTFTVSNLGTQPVPATEKEWDSMLYLSRDGFLDLKSDKFLKEFERDGVLAPGASFDVTLTVQAPADFLGEFQLFAITDPIRSNKAVGDVFEGQNERNNESSVTIQITQPPATDMVVQDVRFTPATLQTGELLRVEWDVANTSGDTAIGQWSDAVYLSSDATWDIQDRPLGLATFTGNVAAGASYSLSLDAFLPSVTPGPYFIIVRNDIFNQVFEGPPVSAGELNNEKESDETLAVTVQEIQLGVPFGTTLSRGQDRLLAVVVPPGETLRVTLQSSSDQSVHEIFLRQDQAPTTSLFDSDYEGGLSPNQISILPTTQDGTVFILIRGVGEPAPNTPVTVTAELLPLTITNVDTDTGGDSAFVTATIRGAKFDQGAVVTLVRPGFATLSPVSFDVIDGTKIIAAFDFTGQPRGLYDVKVTNPDGASAIVPYRFLVERALEPEATIGVGGPRFILAGDVGTYSVAVQGTSNVDTPYIFFQVGIPEMGQNLQVYNLDYLHFFSNVRGADPAGALPGVPFADLNPATNTNGYLLTSGYVYDQHAFGFDGFTFNVETYPGLRELNERNFEQLRERIYAARPDAREAGVLDNGPEGLDLIQPGLFAIYKQFGAVPDFVTRNFVPFQFNVVAAATAMTRAQFIEHVLGEAEQLRQGVLEDTSATAGLLALAADKATWEAAFLASLEQGGVLRPEGSAPPIHENALIQSLMSALATGQLLGPAGGDILQGDLIAFFDAMRLRYGHEENLEAPVDGVHPTSGNAIPVLPTFDQFDLGLSASTTFMAFNVYVPWVPFEDRGRGLPADFQFTGISFDDPSQLANLDLSRFLTGDAAATGVASITGPFSAESAGFLPVNQPLPYTINFQNDPASSSFVNEVRIVADIDEELDTRTFRLGDIRVGDINVDVPSDRGVFQADIDFLDTKGFILRVSAGVDLASNEATWLLQAIDPITGQLITDPNRGLLPPNNALGDGFGFVSYTIATEDDVNTGDQVTASARVFFNNAPPEDTELLTQVIDAAAPTTQLTVARVSPASSNFIVNWNSADDVGGSGFKHVTLYVAEDGGDFAIFQRQLTESSGSEVFVGTPGHTYEFLALATDKAGNREEPPLGVLAPDDGSNVNLGELTDLEGTAPNFGIAPAPAPTPSTNELFVAAEIGDASAVPPVRPPEFDVVLRPFAGRAFATGIDQSHANISAMAIVEAPDGTFIISGGAGRNELFRLGEDGGEVGAPFATLPHPIFNMAFDSQGRLWATTGGGPLLQLDPATGDVVDTFGEGLTIALAVEPGTDRIFVSSNGGVEVFDPATGEFTRFSRDKDLRVGSLAFSPEGELFAVTWPDRASVVKFNPRRRVETVLSFDSLIDSIAFGRPGTRLEGLLFVSHNTGPLASTGAVEPDTSELTMVDTVTLRQVALGQGGSRGDVVVTTSDGRILISQSNQVDVLKPAERPLLVTSNPSDGAVVDPSLATITLTFSEDMLTGDGSAPGSVLNPFNYALSGVTSGPITISGITYDAPSRTVTLTIDNAGGLSADQFALTVSSAVESIDHLSLLQPFVLDFSVESVNLAPSTAADQVATVEDTPVVFSVLLNDTDANSNINPTTVEVVSQPQHGSAAVDPVTGQITYTPAQHYSGPDQFTYTIRDLSGAVSNEATVRLTVSPVADVPTVMAEGATGDQDTAIPLVISAALVDADGSETLSIEIEGVPAAAVLSAGTQTGAGRFRLTPAQLAGLTITPPVGSDDDFTLFVTAIATEQATGQTASSTVLLPVEVRGVTVDPVVVTQFIVNDGKAQRSTIHNLKVRFNQDVHISDLLQDVRLIARKTGAAIPLGLARINYDAGAAQLTIDLEGLALADDHYLLRLSTSGISSAKARDVLLSDTDLRSGDGTVDLEFHRLEADWDGDDVVTQVDGNLLNARYRSRLGESRYDADFDLVKNGVIDQNDYAVWRRALNKSSDTYGPDLALRLVNDTGRSGSDRITFDPTTLGVLRDTGALGTVLAGFDAAATVNITSLVAAGNFTLSIANLQAIKGGAPIADGTHTLNITARDARNNATSIALSFTLDRQAPANPALPDLLAAFDTGSSNSDNITRLTNVQVSTIAETGALVRMQVDGATQAQGLMNGGALALALSLTEGVRTITATAEDVAGNLSGLSPLLSVTVDTTAPVIPAFDTTATANATTTVAGATEPGVRVDLVELGQSTTSSASGSFSFLAPLTLGLNKFTTVATDTAGNSSTFAAAIRRIGPETDAPTVTAGLANDTGLSGSDGITTDPTIAGSVIDPSNTPIGLLLASLNERPGIDVTGALTGSFFTLTPALLEALNGGPLADGAYDVTLSAQDAFLNSSNVVTVSFTLDRAIPATPGAPNLAPGSDLGAADDNRTGDTTPTIEFTGNDGAIVIICVDDVPVGQTTIVDGIGTFTLDPLPEGDHTVTIKATSPSGVPSGQPAPLVITIDTSGPAQPTLLLDPAFDTAPVGDDSTSLEVVTLIGAADAGTIVQLFRGSDLSVPIAQTIATGAGAFSIPGVALGIGANSFTVASIDDAGNIASAAQVITSTAADTRAPEVLLSLKNDTGRSKTDRITFDPTMAGAVNDASAITAFTASIDGKPAVNVLSKLAGGVFTLSKADLNTIFGGTLPDGNHTLTLRATDAGGLQSTPVNLAFTLDTLRPARPDTPDLAAASDSGESLTDNITNQTSLAISGNAESGAILRLFVEGALAGDGVINSGAVNFAVSGLSEGVQRISTRAEDVAGNQSLFSNLLLVTIDTVAPSVPVFGLDESSNTRPFGDNETALENIRLIGVADAGSVLELTNTGAQFVVGADGTFAFKRLSLPTLGDHQFSVKATDIAGNTATGQQTIKRVNFVDSDLLRPQVTLTVSSNTNTVGQTVTLQVTTNDNVSIASRELLIDGVPVAIQPDGSATFTPTNPGFFTAIATAKDPAGNEGQASVEFSAFLDPVISGDNTPPIALIDNADVTGIVREPANLTGTASDANLLRYTLEVSPKDKGQFTVFASGDTNVTGGALGLFDPTVLENGFYDVRLTVTDTSGNTATDSRVLKVEGFVKLGNFTVSFVDSTVNASGIPINATRTYDSRRAATPGDFGFGWNFIVDDIKVSQANVLGDGGFTQSATQVGVGVFKVGFTNTKDVTVSFTMPDGQVETFILGFVGLLTTNANPAPLSTTRLFFEPLPGSGTTSKLEALADNVVNVTPAAFGQVTFTDRATGDLYDPNRWKLTMPDGTVFIIDEAKGIESISDPKGNTLTYTATGITHSDGTGLSIERDALGRIQRITDPAGASVRYFYDFYGDLVKVIDQVGNETQFTYDANHVLLEVIDPLGRRGARNEYDDTGRMIASVDGAGHRIEYTFDTGSRQQVVEDRRGGRTVYEYDALGRIVKETDALGGVTRRSFDAAGNILSMTDAVGNVTLMQYDAQNRMTARTDSLGATTLWTYDGLNNITSVTDPNGNLYDFDYDANGNLLKRTDPLGNETTFTYDARGHMLSMTDALGQTTQYAYDSRGNMIRETDPLGFETDYGYDAVGRRTSIARGRTDELGNVVDSVMQYAYDAKGQLLAQTDAVGNQILITYNAAGESLSTRNSLGREVTYEYDARGNRTAVRFDDGRVETYVYDANGRMTQTTSLLGDTTIYEYDALNRVTRMIDGAGVPKLYDYDAIGRLTRTTDAEGNSLSLEYNGGLPFSINPNLADTLPDRMIAATQADGSRLVFTHDPNGNVIGAVNDVGEATLVEYDALNRRTKTTLPDGVVTSTAYNAIGQVTTATSGDGIALVPTYDKLGRVTQVADNLGNVWTYTFDELSNRLSATDANGRTTRWTYDAGGRVTSRTLPLGMTESWTYGLLESPITHTDFNGDTTTMVYDDFGRLTMQVFDDGSSETFAYDTAGIMASATNALGTISFQYDDAHRLTRVTNTDGKTVDYTYDLRGKIATITSLQGTTAYAYDSLGILSSVTAADGTVTSYGGNSVTATVAHGNGNLSTYITDQLNRLTDIVLTDGTGNVLEQYHYSYTNDNSSRTVTELDGRTVTYTYDLNGRLTHEQITDPVHGNRTIEYTFDNVGNRLSKTDNSLTTVYAYDANDRLLTETTGSDVVTYTYDANGNMISRSDAGGTTSYDYDFENQLIQITLPAGDTIDYGYDATGTLVSRSVNGQVTRYLVDINRDFTQVLEEYDLSGNVIASYVHGLDLISQTRGAAKSFFHTDGQLTTRLLTDAGGAITDGYDYDVFGNLLNSFGATVNTMGYTGELTDPQAGLVYLRARHLDPSTGRFTSMDSFGGLSLDVKSQHKYVYANGDPSTYNDPSGHFAGLLMGMQLVMALYNVAMLSTSILGAIAITGGFFQRLPSAKWTGFSGGVAASAGLGGIGQLQVGGVAGANVSVFPQEPAEAPSGTIIVGAGFSIATAMVLDPKAIAATAVGTFAVGVSISPSFGIDFNDGSPGQAASYGVQIGELWSGGLSIDLPPSDAIGASGAYAATTFPTATFIGPSSWNLTDLLRASTPTMPWQASLSTGLTQTWELFRFNPVAGLVTPEGNIDWDNIYGTIAYVEREIYRAMMYTPGGGLM